MPRTARKKSFDSIFHIMVKSVGDTTLFKKDEDRDMYLGIIKKYQNIFDFKVYAYCLMDSHGHLMIDANGADVSKFMQRINQSYAQRYNKKYERFGHVFADRFRSEIIDDDKYLLVCFGYIHNNCKDIPGWKGKEEEYPYSSFSIYMGIHDDKYNILSKQFMLGIFDENNAKGLKKCRIFMADYMKREDDINVKEHMFFKDQKTDYRSERHIIPRDYSPEDILSFISKHTKTNKRIITEPYNRSSTESKALFILLMTRYCDFSIKDVCNFMGHISQSRVSSLCSMGSQLIDTNVKYQNILKTFIKKERI
ncbi:transposase [Dethiothermospora halolimnae]|uniref:transposase n=1 Tax=Dethiothermospora halolimnae TaxID=3114390 RepID=UPI003CCBAE70